MVNFTAPALEMLIRNEFTPDKKGFEIHVKGCQIKLDKKSGKRYGCSHTRTYKIDGDKFYYCTYENFPKATRHDCTIQDIAAFIREGYKTYQFAQENAYKIREMRGFQLGNCNVLYKACYVEWDVTTSGMAIPMADTKSILYVTDHGYEWDCFIKR